MFLRGVIKKQTQAALQRMASGSSQVGYTPVRAFSVKDLVAA